MIVFEDGGKTEQFLLRDAVAELKGQLIGDRLWDAFGKWPMFSKFFDNKGALPHHIHHRTAHAARVGQMGKPEAYYFAPQVNNYGADYPYTFFGLRPGTTKDEVLQVLKDFVKGDNNITGLAQAYRLEPGTGWDVPPGILHAPGSLCTYEPQCASDVFAMYQSLVGDQVVSEDLLWKDTPPEEKGNFDYLLDVIDWEANVDPLFAQKHFMRPKPVRPVEEMKAEGYCEKWVCYKNRAYSAKELTVHPGQTVTVRDAAAYGMILLQGHGTMGAWEIETPTLIRYGQLTLDEFFVSEQAAKDGVVITNRSKVEDIVMLKHFGADNPDLVVE
ncbi:MAG: hypothetical protein CVV52_19520 [Spirochaetae bacterium HGW-Spirochaetae-8]|nr:MAG: hypothetical protein CVV52_19520 [Spirochaetae bacterium HGW-Spirochaetae-8]